MTRLYPLRAQQRVEAGVQKAFSVVLLKRTSMGRSRSGC
jgi:hypothetical protein